MNWHKWCFQGCKTFSYYLISVILNLRNNWKLWISINCASHIYIYLYIKRGGGRSNEKISVIFFCPHMHPWPANHAFMFPLGCTVSFNNDTKAPNLMIKSQTSHHWYFVSWVIRSEGPWSTKFWSNLYLERN